MAGLLAHMLSRPVAGNAIKLSLFVGTCLYAINQGAAIWQGTGRSYLQLHWFQEGA